VGRGGVKEHLRSKLHDEGDYNKLFLTRDEDAPASPRCEGMFPMLLSGP